MGRMWMGMIVIFIQILHSSAGFRPRYEEKQLWNDFTCLVSKVIFEFRVSPTLTPGGMLESQAPSDHPHWTFTEAYNINCEQSHNQSRTPSGSVSTKTIHLVKPFPQQHRHVKKEYDLIKVTISPVEFSDWWTHTDEENQTWLDVFIMDRMLAFRVEVIWNFHATWEKIPLEFSNFLPEYIRSVQKNNVTDSQNMYSIHNKVGLFDVVLENPWVSYDGTILTVVLQGIHKLNKSLGLYGNFPGESWETLIPKWTNLNCENVDPSMTFSEKNSVSLKCHLSQRTASFDMLENDYSTSLTLGMHYVPLLNKHIPEDIFRWIKYIHQLKQSVIDPEAFDLSYIAGLCIHNSVTLYVFYAILLAALQVVQFYDTSPTVRAYSGIVNLSAMFLIYLLSVAICGYAHVLATIRLFYMDWSHNVAMWHLLTFFWFLYPGIFITLITIPAIFYISDIYRFGKFHFSYSTIPVQKDAWQLFHENGQVNVNYNMKLNLQRSVCPIMHLLVSTYSFGTLIFLTYKNFVQIYLTGFVWVAALAVEVCMYFVLGVGYTIQ